MQSRGSSPLDETPSTTENPELEADLPGFTQPPTPPAAQGQPQGSRPTFSDATTESPDGWAFADEPDSLLNDDEPADKPRASRKSSPVSTNPETFRAIIETLLRLLTAIVHLRLAPKHVDNDLWLADQQDLDAIAPPLARIAARHSPLDAGPAGDVGDAIEVVIGVGGYALKNSMGARELRMSPGWEQQHEQGGQDVAAPPAEEPYRNPFPVPGE